MREKQIDVHVPIRNVVLERDQDLMPIGDHEDRSVRSAMRSTGEVSWTPGLRCDACTPYHGKRGYYREGVPDVGGLES